MKKITLKELAEVAGVSQMTVSRILNGRPYASPETIRKVRMAVEQCGYQYRNSRRFQSINDKGKATNKVTLLMPCPDFIRSLPYASRYQVLILNGALKAAAEEGYALETQPTTKTNRSLEIEWEWLQNLTAGSLILSASVWHIAALQELYRRDCHIAMLSNDAYLHDAFTPLTRNWLVLRGYWRSGVINMVNYLAERKYGKIALALPARMCFEPGEPISGAYEQALNLLNIPYRHIIPLSDSPIVDIRSAYRKNKFDALLFKEPLQMDFNYSMTLAANLGIPTKTMVAVLTADEYYQYFTHEVMMLHYPFGQMAYDAVKLLINCDYQPREITYHSSIKEGNRT